MRSRLEKQRDQIEQALLARVYGVADPTGVTDLSYVRGFRAAASAALDFALSTLEKPDDRAPLVPPILLHQARLAARNGVGLDIVLRRYTAGHAVLVDLVFERAQAEETLTPDELRRLLALSSSTLDHLLASISEEYGRELQSHRAVSTDRRRVGQVERLLAGEPIDTAEIEYEFEGNHVALIGHGLGASEAIRALPSALDCRLLHVSPDIATVWAWLGTRRRLDPSDVVKALGSTKGKTAVALGELGGGVVGWRRSHRQAEAARVVLRLTEEGPVRYADVALSASMLQDDLLQTSLQELYLAPLDEERDGGATLRATLRAYFEARRNISSAAAALGVDRRTVTNRLRVIESKLPKPLGAVLPDIEAALRVEGYQSPLPLK